MFFKIILVGDCPLKAPAVSKISKQRKFVRNILNLVSSLYALNQMQEKCCNKLSRSMLQKKEKKTLVQCGFYLKTQDPCSTDRKKLLYSHKNSCRRSPVLPNLSCLVSVLTCCLWCVTRTQGSNALLMLLAFLLVFNERLFPYIPLFLRR